ncbi:hypothetical protein K505DRAFT_377109 [Melanomma pulvis-pyrius CBS 109.77]|uniref:Uncharacterized protein n=1 Tax=Melanomma pulvis-pyrius CBS 109.77 TaxID=1314802 RepID=A0A6A6X4F6_9PLEO|nr:hypothetical protein K505DRAFT_377109 [Melanomma pulvis-pyrius CBS 109.77]
MAWGSLGVAGGRWGGTPVGAVGAPILAGAAPRPSDSSAQPAGQKGGRWRLASVVPQPANISLPRSGCAQRPAPASRSQRPSCLAVACAPGGCTAQTAWPAIQVREPGHTHGPSESARARQSPPEPSVAAVASPIAAHKGERLRERPPFVPFSPSSARPRPETHPKACSGAHVQPKPPETH